MKLFTLTCLLLIHFSVQAQENNFSFSESYKISEPAQLSVSSSDGNIEVLPSAQSGIELRYIVKRSNKILQISRAELEKEVTLEIISTANSLKINVKYPNSGFFDSNNRITVSFKVLVPKQTACELRTSDGNISVNGLTADQQLYTSDGNIHVSAIKGTMKGRTSDGNISVKEIRGPVDFVTSDGNMVLDDIVGDVLSSTSDGNIQASKIKGDLSLRTSDGHIEFDALEGSVTAVTSDGNIKGSILKLQKRLSLRTGDGNITVTIPDKLGLNLDLRGTSIQTSLKNFSGTSKKELIQGKLNGGGIPVDLRVSDGNVVLSYR